MATSSGAHPRVQVPAERPGAATRAGGRARAALARGAPRFGWRAGLAVTACAAFFLALSFTSHRYWDEYFYLYSALAHAPRDLIALEVESGLFPIGFFSGKIGHVVLLRLLLDTFGTGQRALFAVQLCYALMSLGFVAAGYAVYRQLLDARRARRAALVLLFLPVTLYLGWKTLSEVPSLLLVTLASWAFLRSYRIGGAGGAAVGTSSRAAHLAAASIALALGALCRLTAVVAFGGLLAALLVAGDPRFRRAAVARRGALVGAGAFVLTTLGLWVVGGSDLSSVVLAWRVMTRPHPLERMYALVFFLQAFIVVLAFVPLPPWRRGLRLPSAWLAVSALPFLAGHEPRYYAPALLPLALLASVGLRRLGSLVFGSRRSWGWAVVLGAVVVADRLAFAPLMPYELNQRELTGAVEPLVAAGPAATPAATPAGTVLVPWTSDYGFLRIAFPRLNVVLCLSETNDSDYHWRGRPGPMRPRDGAWAGPGRYAGSRAELARLPGPWYYVGWTYNRPVLRARALLRRVGSHYLDDFSRRDLHSHLAGSWIWYDPALTLTPVARVGQYSVYRVTARAP
ncbi:MAG TPA: glycosyltransferase family 39 protein [Gemmatimonadales bacterium]|nr:glycosyltransferase family 39 protein [Gemmatimonadales bacterium]